jgi:Lysyl oxidase
MRVTPRRARRPLVGVLTFLATLVVGATVAQAAPLLPDLDPAAPGRPRPAAGADGRIYLTFNATFDNVGAGPLVLRGHRGSTAEPTMTADQVIKQSDGTETTVPAVGGFAYDAEYRRWGFAPYIGFELRATDGSLLGAGPDLGFCVIDTKDSNRRAVLPGEPPGKVYTTRSCGRLKPSLLAVEVGISVGYGNLHSAGNKGQMIDITDLPTGRYVLVHRVNAAGLLTEASTANNASSALVEITWVAGQPLPSVRTVRNCASSETCL